MISKGGKVTFNDPGTGEYTRQYFSNERYTVLEPSSRAHSVPIINGSYQICKKEKADIFAEREKPESLVERFVSLVEPKIENGKISVGASELEYDATIFDFELNQDVCNRAGGVKETLYMLDFKPKKLEKQMKFTFIFK